MSNQEKLSLCPFCKSKYVGVVLCESLFAVECHSCMACGSSSKNRNEAIRAWNSICQPVEGDVVETVARAIEQSLKSARVASGGQSLYLPEAHATIAAMQPAIEKAVAEERARYVSYYETFYPEDEWNEEDGNVLWWRLPICQPPYCGTPNDSDFPPNWATHFTRIVKNSVILSVNKKDKDNE